jgi:hypothetical protein
MLPYGAWTVFERHHVCRCRLCRDDLQKNRSMVKRETERLILEQDIGYVDLFDLDGLPYTGFEDAQGLPEVEDAQYVAWEEQHHPLALEWRIAPYVMRRQLMK